LVALKARQLEFMDPPEEQFRLELPLSQRHKSLDRS
jgi:hypothetical protein